MVGELERPPVHLYEDGNLLVDAFVSCGIVELGAMGDQPLSWSGIHTWATLTETHLSPAGFEALREMSLAYLFGAEEYREKIAPSPFLTESAVSRAKVAARLSGIFDSLARKGASRRKSSTAPPLKVTKRVGR